MRCLGLGLNGWIFDRRNALPPPGLARGGSVSERAFFLRSQVDWWNMKLTPVPGQPLSGKVTPLRRHSALSGGVCARSLSRLCSASRRIARVRRST